MTQFGKLKVGSKLSEVQYYSVDKIKGDKVQLRNDMGEHIVVDSKYVESCITSADQFTETKNVTKTEAANILLSNPGVVMTICFNKQVKEADVVKEIMEAYEGSTVKTMESAIKKAVKHAITGVERVMVGRHFGELNELGRVNFVDMEEEKDMSKAYDNRIRQVDPRTVNWLIVRNVKYTVK